ncbi:MAG: hypothetical protein Q7T30_00725 [Planctomycetota bacterium]|nr:hypothetical protein [Planctomycetota bacterium]
MRIVTLVAVSLLFVADTMAQGGGGRGRGRAEEITNRVGAFFTDIPGPVADGEKVAELATVDLVRAATGAGQLSVLYLYDSADDADVRDQFERTLFGSDEVGIELRCFHCGRIDLAKEASLKGKFGKQAPLFVVFDKDGKSDELSMTGYKASASSLQKLLEKSATGVIKPSLAAFAKEYGGMVRDIEQLLAKKKQAQEKQAKAGEDKAKRSEAEKDQKAIEAEEKKALEGETDFLRRNRLPERGAEARRLGGRGRGEGRGEGRPGEGRGGAGAGRGGNGG